MAPASPTPATPTPPRSATRRPATTAPSGGTGWATSRPTTRRASPTSPTRRRGPRCRSRRTAAGSSSTCRRVEPDRRPPPRPTPTVDHRHRRRRGHHLAARRRRPGPRLVGDDPRRPEGPAGRRLARRPDAGALDRPRRRGRRRPHRRSPLTGDDLLVLRTGRRVVAPPPRRPRRPLGDVTAVTGGLAAVTGWRSHHSRRTWSRSPTRRSPGPTRSPPGGPAPHRWSSPAAGTGPRSAAVTQVRYPSTDGTVGADAARARRRPTDRPAPRRSSPATAGSTSPRRRRGARSSPRGASSAARWPSRACGAGARRARRGTRPACGPTSRRCSPTSRRPPTGSSPRAAPRATGWRSGAARTAACWWRRAWPGGPTSAGGRVRRAAHRHGPLPAVPHRPAVDPRVRRPRRARGAGLAPRLLAVPPGGRRHGLPGDARHHRRGGQPGRPVPRPQVRGPPPGGVDDDPVLLRVESAAGHGQGKPATKQIEERPTSSPSSPGSSDV